MPSAVAQQLPDTLPCATMPRADLPPDDARIVDGYDPIGAGKSVRVIGRRDRMGLSGSNLLAAETRLDSSRRSVPAGVAFLTRNPS